jgi:hypothetical protein
LRAAIHILPRLAMSGALLGILLIPLSVSADTVLLKDGTEHEGIVVEQNGEVVMLKMKGGAGREYVTKFARDKVKSVTLDMSEEAKQERGFVEHRGDWVTREERQRLEKEEALAREKGELAKLDADVAALERGNSIDSAESYNEQRRGILEKMVVRLAVATLVCAGAFIAVRRLT